jgi:orotate phosphoribosyltransferase
MDTAHHIACKLLESGAIWFNFVESFTWSSGLRAPIYCNSRRSLAIPEIRTFVTDAYIDAIEKHFPDVDAIVGVATGAIAHGALIADRFDLPFSYICEKIENQRLQQIVNCNLPAGKKVVVIEDQISTGASSLKVVEELRKADVCVLGMIATFTYEFKSATRKFEEAKYRLVTLSSFSVLVEQAIEDGYITATDAERLKEWHRSIKN